MATVTENSSRHSKYRKTSNQKACRTEFSTYAYTGAAPADRFGRVDPAREALTLVAIPARSSLVGGQQPKSTSFDTARFSR
jgi:hypothetical protein